MDEIGPGELARLAEDISMCLTRSEQDLLERCIVAWRFERRALALRIVQETREEDMKAENT